MSDSDKKVLGRSSPNRGVSGRNARNSDKAIEKSTQKNSSGNSDGQKAISTRNDFYADGASFMKKYCYITGFFFLCSIGATYYSASQKENNVYFAAKSNRDLIQLVALDQPNMSNAAVTNWLAKALVDTFDFRYNNVNTRLSESANKWFTPEGGSELIKALTSGGNLSAVEEKQLFVQLTLDTAPILIDQAKDSSGDYYAWKYEVSGMISYITRTKTYVDKVNFKITVQRQSMISNPDGLGIAKIIMLVKR